VPGGISETRLHYDELLIPEVVVEEYGAEIGVVLRPALDALWNAWDYLSCHYYDQNGSLKP